MLEDGGGTGDAAETPRRLADDVLVVAAVGLTLAALLSILALVANRAAPPGVKFGDRVLLFDQSGPFGQFGYGLLAVAALAVACIAPVDGAARRIVGSLRAIVGLVAAAAVVVTGYGVFAFATDAAIGHTQFMATWGTAARTASVGFAASSFLLAACALWFVTRPADDPADDTTGEVESEPAGVQAPRWTIVSAAAVLTMVAALALLELVVEPIVHPESGLGVGHQAFITRLDRAVRAFGAHPIALLTFVVIGLMVAARGRDESSGARLLGLASTVSVVGIAVAIFVVIRVIANHDAVVFNGTKWDRTEAIATALASGLVAAVAWAISLRFGTGEQRAATLAASSPYRVPSVTTVRVASVLVGLAAVGIGVWVVTGYAVAHNPAPFGLKTDGASEAVMLTVGIVLGAALLAELARAASTNLIGRAFLAVLAAAALVLGGYAFIDSLAVKRTAFNVTTLQRHGFAAFGAAAAFLGLAVLSVLVNGQREDPDADEAAAEELEAA